MRDHLRPNPTPAPLNLGKTLALSRVGKMRNHRMQPSHSAGWEAASPTDGTA